MLQIWTFPTVFILIGAVCTCKVNDITWCWPVSVVRRIHRRPARKLILTNQGQVIEMLASSRSWFRYWCHFLSLIVTIKLVVEVCHTLKLLLSLWQSCLIEVLRRSHTTLMSYRIFSVHSIFVEVYVLFLLCWHVLWTTIRLESAACKTLTSNLNIT